MLSHPGMNDVLPKPFTKEGMLRTLEKHLQQFKKNFIHPSQAQPPHSAVTVYSTSSSNNTPITMTMSHMSATQSIKDEASPSTSKSPTSSWHSPNQITGQSPTNMNPNVQANFSVMQANGAFAMAPIGYPTTAAQVVQAQAQAQAHAQAHAQAQAMPGPGPPRQTALGHRRVISDIQQDVIEGDRPDKRQRMFAPGPPVAYPQ
jgi:osomolarity two-component system response regulator SKN7